MGTWDLRDVHWILQNLCPFLSAVSEVESTKGSGDCLPKLNYQNSGNGKATSSIVRLNGTIGSTVAQGSRGECREIHIYPAWYLWVLSTDPKFCCPLNLHYFIAVITGMSAGKILIYPVWYSWVLSSARKFCCPVNLQYLIAVGSRGECRENTHLPNLVLVSSEYCSQVLLSTKLAVFYCCNSSGWWKVWEGV